jgi:peptide/nickel transport system permease protein
LLTYILRRLLFLMPVLFGMTLIAFVVGHTMPTDPVVSAIGDQAATHPAIVIAYREKWGLDKPLTEQYIIYMKRLLHGDLGVSIYTHRPVTVDILDYLPATVELATAAITISIVMAVPLGVISAVNRGGVIDFGMRMVSLVGVAMPIFFLALLSISVLYVWLGIVPSPSRLSLIATPPPRVTGLYTIDSLIAGQFSTFLDAFAHLILPAVVLASWSIGLLLRVTRTATLSVLHQDYLRTARAKGAREFYVIRRHGLRNALIPVVTIIGLSYGDLLSGSILIETIFAWPGIGRYAYTAATEADFPAIIGVALMVAFFYTIVNLVVDVVYALLDPRVRSTIMALRR